MRQLAERDHPWLTLIAGSVDGLAANYAADTDAGPHQAGESGQHLGGLVDRGADLDGFLALLAAPRFTRKLSIPSGSTAIVSPPALRLAM